MSKRLLIVSPHFPPVNAPDMQRIRVSLPAFVAAGWEVTVLTVADPTPTAPLEPELSGTVPGGVRVERSHCFSRRWTGRLGVNNVALRSLPFLFLRGCRLLLARRYDVVYFSTTMFVVLPLGRLWHLLSGTPYVIDLQDPWISDFYDRPGAPRPPGGWKFRLAQGLGHALEGWTMRGVAHLIVVSAAYGDAIRRRNPKGQSISYTELPFGSPDPDFEHLRASLATRPRVLPGDRGLCLAFAGAIGPGQLAAVERLFAAIAALRAAGPELTVHFFGTSYSPQGQPVTLALAARYGLQGAVFEQPGRLRYFDALQVTLEADVNLLFGSTELAFTPSKILAVLAAGKPVLALAPTGSAMGPRLAELGQACVLFNPADPAAAANREINALLQALAAGRAPATDASALARFSARAMAERQLDILAAAAG